jgi:CheY-like chemotaxis protein
MGRVLIVDDNPEMLILLSTVIGLIGYETRISPSGSEALAIIHSEDIDLVLLDLMMPILDGYETLIQLRAMERGASLPVIILTAGADPDVEDRMRAAGANGLLYKPADMSTLEKMLAEYLVPASLVPAL